MKKAFHVAQLSLAVMTMAALALPAPAAATETIPTLSEWPASLAPAPNLRTTLSPPAGIRVYEMGRYNMTVANIGTKDAQGVSLVIQLPETHTSPQVYVMGDLGAKSTSCVLSGTHYTCTLGTIKKNKSKAVYFDISLPESAAPLNVTATASTITLPETDPLNNVATHTATLIKYNVPMNPLKNAVNRHCTGTGLTAFFECTKFPTSISSHRSVFHPGGSISFPDEPDYYGIWNQDPNNDTRNLHFEYYDLNNVLVATFDGHGVGISGVHANCYEGMTTFPGSNYVSPYEVCITAP